MTFNFGITYYLKITCRKKKSFEKGIISKLQSDVILRRETNEELRIGVKRTDDSTPFNVLKAIVMVTITKAKRAINL